MKNNISSNSIISQYGNKRMCPSATGHPSDARIEKKVESLLKKMTLEEKVGQMCEITIDVITDFSSPNDFKLSEALLDTVIGKYKIGPS